MRVRSGLTVDSPTNRCRYISITATLATQQPVVEAFLPAAPSRNRCRLIRRPDTVAGQSIDITADWSFRNPLNGCDFSKALVGYHAIYRPMSPSGRLFRALPMERGAGVALRHFWSLLEKSKGSCFRGKRLLVRRDVGASRERSVTEGQRSRRALSAKTLRAAARRVF